MCCPKCGGSIIGDGYTDVMHCENAEESEYYDKEPDAPVVYCSFEEDGERSKYEEKTENSISAF